MGNSHSAFKPDGVFLCHFFESLAEKIPDDGRIWQYLGQIYSTAGRISEALKADLRASLLEPENPKMHYNLACSFALSGNSSFALEHLRLARKLGFFDRELLKKDPDLKSLRELPEFISFLKDWLAAD